MLQLLLPGRKRYGVRRRRGPRHNLALNDRTGGLNPRCRSVADHAASTGSDRGHSHYLGTGQDFAVDLDGRSAHRLGADEHIAGYRCHCAGDRTVGVAGLSERSAT